MRIEEMFNYGNRSLVFFRLEFSVNLTFFDVVFDNIGCHDYPTV